VSGRLAPPIADRDLAEEVLRGRDAATQLFEETRAAVEPAIRGRIAAYRAVLDDLAELLRIPLDTSDLDLTADTRWTALWQLSARSISLAHGLLLQVEAGLCAESFPTARAIFEANRLIEVFLDRNETDLLHQWLNDVPPKPATVQRAIDRIDARYDAMLVRAGERPPASRRRLAKQLYAALSESAHLRRSNTQLAVSSSLRTLVVGPDPDWGRRAYFVGWAGEVVWEVARVFFMAQTLAGGSRLVEPVEREVLAEIKAAAVRFPIGESHQRNGTLELA
jgi:hypothetical protein